jgi:hypothetical protein
MIDNKCLNEEEIMRKIDLLCDILEPFLKSLKPIESIALMGAFYGRLYGSFVASLSLDLGVPIEEFKNKMREHFLTSYKFAADFAEQAVHDEQNKNNK